MSTRGRVTIPKDVRERLGLRVGTVIEWTEQDDGVVGKVVTIEGKGSRSGLDG